MENSNFTDSVDSTPNIKAVKVVYPQVYSYILPEIGANEGSQKIGYTERKDVNMRIHEQTHTAAIKLKSETLWSAPAFFADSQKDFNDKTFHKFLAKNQIENRTDLGKEWFYFNGTPEKSKELFDAFRDHGFEAASSAGKVPYLLRAEQQSAVENAINYFESHDGGEFLWNAKPRFGKTLASYDLAKRLGATKVLIVTNRPAIANSWLDDFETFIDGYNFISETQSLANRQTLTRDQYIKTGSDKPQITFMSLQDLKGSKYFGGNHDKLGWIANLEWDLLIIDEAHEGVDTDRTDAAFDIIKRNHTLHLSGTPFKALSNNKFSVEAIFNWTYLDEQKIKQAEQEEGEIGDHTDLPDLKLYTYRISQMITDEVNEGIEIDDKTRDFAFDLNEFFATKNQVFVHEDDVKEFLKNLTSNAKYPFSTPELRDQLKHTFWYVGNRVDSVKALEQLLKTDAVFKDYKVIVAAGDGKTFEEEETDFKGNEKSYDKVKNAIKEHDKTITLSCGQLTTGVTIKEWSAVLMLTDLKTPAQYMQAAFRAQNPYRFYEDGQLKSKESAYLFDFAPTRVLEIYDQFANGLNGKAVNGEITESERKENIKELLNFFPVISEDINGQMVELDAEKVLTFPNALAAAEIVKARFMTNLLFNDNIKGVFQFPKEVEDILEKMPVEKNKRVEVAKTELNLDDARKVEHSKQTNINENKNIILGEKIFRSNIERVVDNVLSVSTPEETLDTLPSKVADLAEPIIAKYKNVYKATNDEIDEIRNDTKEKIRLVVAEYERSDIKDAKALKENLAKIIELDFVEQKVEQKEAAIVENVKKTKEDEVRDRLRSFTRTIPMFIMANTSKETITIDNFDLEISDSDFVDLTNITKAEFHKLRDGFNFELDGERKSFGGVFDRYKFNASIAEFVAKKQKRSDYFNAKEDIFELIPNQKNNQIFTPIKVVKMMIDHLEKESPELFQRTDSTFIDLYMKSGMYITEITKRLFTNTRAQYTNNTECIKHILEHQVYGLAPTGILQGITQSYIFGFDDTHHISTNNFKQYDLLPNAKNGTATAKIADLFNQGGTMMKFDAVVGNPPYQVSGDARDEPVYHYFYNSAKSLSERYALISPARFLFGAGQTPRLWNEIMLSDEHLEVALYEQDSSKIFPSTDIKGGVAIIYRDNSRKIGPIGTFTHVPELTTIAKKVPILDNISFSRLVQPQGIYRFSKMFFIIFPQAETLQGVGTKNKIVSKSFSEMNFAFSDQRKTKDDIKMLGLVKGKRLYKWISRQYLSLPDSFEKWKIFIPEANGSGAIGEVFSTPLIGEPLIGHTDTFLTVGSFDNEIDAQNCLKYTKSKFTRTMLGILKITQHNSRSTWQKIPMQDFTPKSDIDWTKSISEIDQQLYKKYGLNDEEISFIETKVKAME
jgi:superfamily II DNA or RNA helicase